MAPARHGSLAALAARYFSQVALPRRWQSVLLMCPARCLCGRGRCWPSRFERGHRRLIPRRVGCGALGLDSAMMAVIVAEAL